MIGDSIQQKYSIQYLGALISADGSIQSEINRRIGMVSADFKLLDILWTHAKVSQKQKYLIYQACIVSKLLYGLQTAWLTKAQNNKLDGFHAKCVRKIVGIQHNYWSRVSNKDVLSRVNAVQLSKLLLEQQLLVFEKYTGKVQVTPYEKLYLKTILAPCRSIQKQGEGEDQNWHGL